MGGRGGLFPPPISDHTLLIPPSITVVSGPLGVMSKMASTAESQSIKYRAILKSMAGLVDFIDGGDSMKLALRLYQEELLNANTCVTNLNLKQGVIRPAKKLMNYSRK